MNRNVSQQAGATPALKRILSGALLGAAIAAAPVAQAATRTTELTFEGVETENFGNVNGGDVLTQGGYVMEAYSLQPGSTGTLVGQLIDGGDLGAGGGKVALPTQHASTYYAGLNDSLLTISAANGATFRLASLQASFIGYSSAATYASVAGFLGVEYRDASDGQFYDTYVAFPSFQNGSFTFGNYSITGALASTDMTELTFFAYSCELNAATCNAFTSNRGQFALDNIVLTSAVPEPASYAMMLLGLAGVGAAARRRQRQNGRAA